MRENNSQNRCTVYNMVCCNVLKTSEMFKILKNYFPASHKPYSQYALFIIIITIIIIVVVFCCFIIFALTVNVDFVRVFNVQNTLLLAWLRILY